MDSRVKVLIEQSDSHRPSWLVDGGVPEVK